MTLYPVNGTSRQLYIDITTPVTTYGPDVIIPGNFDVVCDLTGGDFAGTTDNIDTSGKCSGAWKTGLPGAKGWTISGTGNQQNLPLPLTDDRMSQNQLFQYWKTDRKFWVAIYDSSLNYVRYGVGYFTNVSEPNPYNAAATFDFTVQGDGEVWDQSATT